MSAAVRLGILAACLLGCGGGGARVPATDGASDGGGAPGDGPGDREAADAARDAGGFQPAPHPALPRVANLGGAVLATPKVLPIFYESDTNGPEIRAFLDELTRTTYWQAVTSEYGIGPLTVLPPITMAAAAPATITDDTLRATVAASTSGPAGPWGPADPSVIYLFVLPEGTIGTLASSDCCSDFGGYHSETRSGSTTVPYAVGCSCSGTFSTTTLEQRTVTISHELVEAATDPFPSSNPAYQGLDQADLVWSLVTGGEVGDMCAFNRDATFVPPGATYMVQRTWSNAAAAAAQNPCVPATTAAPFFTSLPELETVTYHYAQSSYVTQGLQIPLGQSRTIDLDLFSSGPTAGPWTVSIYPIEEFFGGAVGNLGLSLNKSSGTNGDHLQLTITPRNPNPQIGAEIFIISSQNGYPGTPGYQTNLSMGLVIN